MATIRFYPTITKSLHYRIPSSWHHIKNGTFDEEFDTVAGVKSISESPVFTISSNGYESGEPSSPKFLENSRIGISFDTSSLWQETNIISAKLFIKVKTAGNLGSYNIEPDLRVVDFNPLIRNNFAGDDYNSVRWKTGGNYTFLSDEIIDGSNLAVDFECIWNLTDTDTIRKKGDVSPYTVFGIINNFDIQGTPPWDENNFRNYDIYGTDDSVFDRPYLEIEYEETQQFQLNFIEEEEMPVVAPGGSGGSGGGPIHSDDLVFHVNANNSDSYGGSGTTWSDLVTSGNKFEMTGATFSGSSGSQYWSFDGTNDYGTATPYYDNNGTRGQDTETLSWEIDEDVSVEFWYKGTNTGGTASTGVQSIIGDRTGGIYWELGMDSNGYFAVAWYDGGWNNYSVGSDGDINDDEWHHCVYTRDAGTVIMYVDGENVGNTTHGDFDGHQAIMNSMMRGYPYESDIYCQGSLSLLRVYKATLTAENVTTNYESGHFHDGVSSGGGGGGGSGDENWDDVVLLINGTETFATTFSDKSDTPHTITVNGSAINQTTSNGGKWLEGYDFSGGSANTDYLSIPDSTDWTFGSDPFTIEFWIYLNPQATNTGTRNIFSHGNASGQEHFLSVYNNGGNLQMDWNVRGGLSSNVAVWDSGGDTNISSEEWIHVALVRNGTLWSMYFNGRFKYSVSGPSGSIQDYSNDFCIGVQSGSTSRNPFSGYIDDFRITKGVARYSGTDTSADWENFDEPTTEWATSEEGGSPAGGIAGDPHWDQVSTYRRFNENLDDESELGGDIEIYGINRLSTDDKWVGTGSLEFHTNAYTGRSGLRLYGDSVNFSDNNLAIEFQFKINQVLASSDDVKYYLMDFRSLTSLPTGFPEYIYVKNRNLYYKSGASSEVLIKTGIYEDTSPEGWHHLLFTRQMLGDDLTTNGNLELWHLGLPTGWSAVNSTDSITNELELLRTKDSYHTLKMVADVGEGIKNTTAITTVSGKTYRLSYYIYTPDATKVKSVAHNGSSEITNSVTSLSLENWTLVEFDFNANSTTTHVHILSDEADKIFYIDDIKLQLKEENYRIFVDGVISAGGAIQTSPTFYDFLGEEVWINSQYDNLPSSTTYNADSNGLQLFIDELRVTNGHHRYDSNFTAHTTAFHNFESPITVGDPHWAETNLLLHYDSSSIYDSSAGDLLPGGGGYSDSSKSVKTVGILGEPNVTTEDEGTPIKEIQMGVGALSLDGDNDYLFVEDHTDFDIGIADFTAETYLKINDFKSENMFIFGFDGSSVEDSDWRLSVASTGRLYFEDRVDDQFYIGSTSLSVDTWYNVAIVRVDKDVTNSYLNFYIDGQRTDQWTVPKSSFSTVATNRFIGHSENDDTNGNWDGYLDETRITIGVGRYEGTSYIYDESITYPHVLEYDKYENPFNSVQTEETSFVTQLFESKLLPFDVDIPQFSGEFHLLPNLTRGALLHNTGKRTGAGWTNEWFDNYDVDDPDGTQANQPRGDLFQFVEGSVVYAEHWLETNPDQNLNTTDDLIAYNQTLDTSTIPVGATLTHLVVGQQEYFSIDDNSFVVTAEQTRVDNWYHQQFQFSNGQWAGMEHNYYDDVGIGRQENSSLEDYSNSYYGGVFVFDQTTQPTLVISESNTWYSTLGVEIMGYDELYFKEEGDIVARDYFDYRDFQFSNEWKPVYQENYTDTLYDTYDNRYAFLDLIFDERVQRAIIDSGEYGTQKITKLTDDLLPGLEDQYWLIESQIVKRDYFVQNDFQFINNMMQPVQQENYTHTYYDTYVNNISPEGFVLDERVQKTIIDDIDGQRKIILSKDNLLTTQETSADFTFFPHWENVIGNYFNQSYQFDSSFVVVPDATFEPQYGDVFTNFTAISFNVLGGNYVKDDVFEIYRDQSNSGTDKLVTLTTVPDPSLKYTDAHWSNVELLITADDTVTDIKNSTAPTVTGAVSYEDAVSTIGTPSNWLLEEMNVVLLDDNTHLTYSGVDVSTSKVTIDWWGYRDTGYETGESIENWWSGLNGSSDLSRFSNIPAQTGSSGTTGNWTFYTDDPSSINALGFLDIDDIGWHHWAFVKDGSNMYFFLDGDLKGSATLANNILGFDKIGEDLKGYIKNFRVTKNVARWTSNDDFADNLSDLKGEWTSDGKLQTSNVLGFELSNILTDNNSTGINVVKTSTGAGGRTVTGVLQNSYDYTTTVEDDRWQFGSGSSPITVFDEKAGGTKVITFLEEFHDSNMETQVEEPVEDILRFYNFIQVFGDTLSNQGYNLGDVTVTADQHRNNVILHFQSNSTDENTTIVDTSNSSIYTGTKTITSTGGSSGGVRHSTDVDDPFGGSLTSLYFDSYDWISMNDVADWDFGTDEYTVEYWHYPKAYIGSWHTILEMGQHNSGVGLGIWWNSDSKYIRVHHGGSYWDTPSSSWSYGEWYHVAHVRDSSGNLSTYLNGNRIHTTTGAGQDIQNTTGAFYIGRFTHSHSPPSYTTHGYIQDFRITRGVARYSGTSLTVPTELFYLTATTTEAHPDNTITIDDVNYLLQEDQETPIDFELPQDSTEYEVYQIQPSSIGYDNLTKDNFQFTNSGVEHVLDNRLTSLITQNSFEYVNSTGMNTVADSGRYNDVTVNSTTFLPDYSGSEHANYPTGASSDVLYLETEFTTYIYENLAIGYENFTFPVDEQKLTGRDYFSGDNFQFLSGNLEAILDGGFANSSITSNGTPGDNNELNDYPQLKEFVSGRIVLDETHVNQYDVNGDKVDKMQTIGEETIVADESDYDLYSDIVARDYFGGDYLQMADGKIVPVIEAVKFLDVDTVSAQNAFLNLHAKVTTEVSFSYDSATARLTVNFDSATPNMHENYDVDDEVWVGRFVANESGENLIISNNYVWTIVEVNSGNNYIVLNVPANQVTIINPPTEGGVTVDGTILMSSMNMASLMYYYKNL